MLMKENAIPTIPPIGNDAPVKEAPVKEDLAIEEVVHFSSQSHENFVPGNETLTIDEVLAGFQWLGASGSRTSVHDFQRESLDGFPTWFDEGVKY
jgi:hypothetical protein